MYRHWRRPNFFFFFSYHVPFREYITFWEEYRIRKHKILVVTHWAILKFEHWFWYLKANIKLRLLNNKSSVCPFDSNTCTKLQIFNTKSRKITVKENTFRYQYYDYFYPNLFYYPQNWMKNCCNHVIFTH